MGNAFEELREFAGRRHQDHHRQPRAPGTRTDQLASLARAVANALHVRGVDDPAAILAAETGITVFRVSFERWVDPGNTRTLRQLMAQSLHELRAVTAGVRDPEWVAVPC